MARTIAPGSKHDNGRLKIEGAVFIVREISTFGLAPSQSKVLAHYGSRLNKIGTSMTTMRVNRQTALRLDF